MTNLKLLKINLAIIKKKNQVIRQIKLKKVNNQLINLKMKKYNYNSRKYII